MLLQATKSPPRGRKNILFALLEANIMKKDSFLVRLVLNAVAFLIVARLYSGMTIDGFWEALIAGLIWGILNALLRPLLMLLTLPLNFLTFGLFTFVVNGIILLVTAHLYSGLQIPGYINGIIAALLLSIVNMILSIFLVEDKKK